MQEHQKNLREKLIEFEKIPNFPQNFIFQWFQKEIDSMHSPHEGHFLAHLETFKKQLQACLCECQKNQEPKQFVAKKSHFDEKIQSLLDLLNWVNSYELAIKHLPTVILKYLENFPPADHHLGWSDLDSELLGKIIELRKNILHLNDQINFLKNHHYFLFEDFRTLQQLLISEKPHTTLFFHFLKSELVPKNYLIF